MDLRASLSLGAAVTGLCGCIASVKYPAEWAEIRGSECADLSGSYENSGVIHSPTQMWSGPFEVRPTSLAPLFFKGDGRTLSDPQRAVHIQLDARTPGLLGITATMPSGQAVPITLRQDKDEFRCRDGSIELSSAEFGVAFVIVGVGGTNLRLSKAADGALIVAGHDQMVGTALVPMPIYWSSRTYARFDAVPEQVPLPAAAAGQPR
jgi:hypothetical protein